VRGNGKHVVGEEIEMVDLEDIATVLVAWGLDPDCIFAAANDGDERTLQILRFAEDEAVALSDLNA